MPAGLSWPRYLTFLVAAFVTTAAGAQTVHNYYKPLDDLEKLVEEEYQRRLQQLEQLSKSKVV